MTHVPIECVQWEVMLVDEGHRLKNERSRLFSTLNSWSVRRRFLLTGTPIQNTLSELWALLHFLLPTVFASHDNFDVWFAAGFVGNTPVRFQHRVCVNHCTLPALVSLCDAALCYKHC